jgi:hypothetical protein
MPSSLARAFARLADPFWRNAERIADEFERDERPSGDPVAGSCLVRQLVRLPACTASGR